MQLNGRYRKRVAVYLSRIAVIIVEGEEPVTGIQVIARLTLNTWLQAKSGKSIRQLRWVKNGAKITSSHPSRSLDLRSKIHTPLCMHPTVGKKNWMLIGCSVIVFLRVTQD